MLEKNKFYVKTIKLYIQPTYKIGGFFIFIEFFIEFFKYFLNIFKIPLTKLLKFSIFIRENFQNRSSLCLQ